MPSNPTHPGPFSHTWGEREPFGPPQTPLEDDEPIVLPLHRRWPAVVGTSALMIALGAGLFLIQRSASASRVSLGPTGELPMVPREFEPSPAPGSAGSRAPEAAAQKGKVALPSAMAPPAAPPREVRVDPAPRRSTPPPRRDPPAVTPPPTPRDSDESRQTLGIDFGSPETLRPPDEPMLNPDDLAPREAPEPADDDLPDGGVPDGGGPDAEVPDSGLPDAQPDPGYSPELGF